MHDEQADSNVHYVEGLATRKELIRLDRVGCEAKKSAVVVKSKKPCRNEWIWWSALSKCISKYSAANCL
jgi:hypothetical protein